MFNPMQNASDHLAISQGCYFDEAQGYASDRVHREVLPAKQRTLGGQAAQAYSIGNDRSSCGCSAGEHRTGCGDSGPPIWKLPRRTASRR